MTEKCKASRKRRHTALPQNFYSHFLSSFYTVFPNNLWRTTTGGSKHQAAGQILSPRILPSSEQHLLFSLMETQRPQLQSPEVFVASCACMEHCTWGMLGRLTPETAHGLHVCPRWNSRSCLHQEQFSSYFFWPLKPQMGQSPQGEPSCIQFFP